MQIKVKASFDRKPNQIPPFGIRIQPNLQAVGFMKRNVLQHSIPATPPWLLKRPHVSYSLHHSLKDDTSPEIYRNKFFEFCDHYKGYFRLYTDSSWMEDCLATAVVHKNITKAIRLPKKASVSRPELYAISVIRHSKEKKFYCVL